MPASAPRIRVKRTYEPPARGDGRRFLVERLWPRATRKDALAMDAWLKEVAPSTELRRWFGHRVERWEEFRKRYRAELRARPATWRPILEAARRGPVTLLYSARDEEHNGARVLRDFLLERAQAERPRRAPTSKKKAQTKSKPKARRRS